jgi:hypothetical protein
VVDLANTKADASTTYSKGEVDNALALKTNTSTTALIDSRLTSAEQSVAKNATDIGTVSTNLT